MNLYQYTDGYRYTSDVMFLYDFISSFNPKGNMLDVGCGCGVLGLLLKRDFPLITLTSLDIQKEHIALTCKNLKENKIEANTVLDDFRVFNNTSKYDIIVSNPPFYTKTSKKTENTRLMISRYSENLPLKDFLSKSYKVLNNSGYIYFCYDASQIDTIIMELKNNKFQACNILFVHSKKSKEAYLVLIRARKDSKSLIKISPPLFVFKKTKYTNRAKKIFEKTKTKSISWH